MSGGFRTNSVHDLSGGGGFGSNAPGRRAPSPKRLVTASEGLRDLGLRLGRVEQTSLLGTEIGTGDTDQADGQIVLVGFGEQLLGDRPDLVETVDPIAKSAAPGPRAEILGPQFHRHTAPFDFAGAQTCGHVVAESQQGAKNGDTIVTIDFEGGLLPQRLARAVGNDIAVVDAAGQGMKVPRGGFPEGRDQPVQGMAANVADRANPQARQLLLRFLSCPEQARNRQGIQEVEHFTVLHDHQAVRLVEVAADLRDELARSHADGNAQPLLLEGVALNALRDRHPVTEQATAVRDIEKGLVDAQRLHLVGVAPENGHELPRLLEVALHPTVAGTPRPDSAARLAKSAGPSGPRTSALRSSPSRPRRAPALPSGPLR